MKHKHSKKGRRQAIVNECDGSESGPVKVSMDYFYLHERSGNQRDENYNPPHLAVIEHRRGRIWAYRVPNKGIMGDAKWLPKKIVNDLNDNGMQDVMWHVKTDQEPAIVALQSAIQELCPNRIIPTNSPVGESACNGRAENAIRRIQEKVRALRHQIESGMKKKLPDESPVMAWLVRWAAELLSKYAPGEDGKAPYERIRQEKCLVPRVPFGERVTYLPLQNVRRSKGVPAKRPGIWLGVNERTEEIIIGTSRRVVKCRTVSRLADGDQWCHDTIAQMKGLPWEPVPGRPNQGIPTNINEDGDCQDEEADEITHKANGTEDEPEEQAYRKITDSYHVSQKAINRYGTTEGCPACRVIQRRGYGAGRIGYNHSTACRERIVKLMRDNPEQKPTSKKTQQDLHAIKKNVDRAIECINEKMSKQQSNLGTMLNMLISHIQVAEVYSPPRVVEAAKAMGLRGGWSLDLTTQDVDGSAWDFNKLHMRNRAVHKVLTDKPLVLIGNPMCTAFSAMNHINYAKMSPEEVERRLAYARKHLDFCIKLYEMQWKAGRYFLHEHPDSASSWYEKSVQRLAARQGVMRVVGDQCRYGLPSRD